MDWQRHYSFLSVMVRENKSGTEKLYRKIPFVVRKKLHQFVDSISWSQLRDNCQQNLPDAEKEALHAYNKILNIMDSYIQQENGLITSLESMSCENCEYMALAKQNIVFSFGRDGVSFVQEMAELLENEKSLIYQFSSKEVEEVPRIMDTGESERRQEYVLQISALQKDVDMIMELLKVERRNVSDLEVLKAYEELKTMSPSDLQELDASTLASIQNIQTADTTDSQRAVEQLTDVMGRLSCVMDSLQLEVKDWRTSETHASVKTGLLKKLEPLKDDFRTFGNVLNSLAELLLKDSNLTSLCEGATSGLIPAGQLATLNKQLMDVEERFFSCNLIVRIQPKDMVCIEVESKSAVKGKKKDSIYRSKKRQGLNTTIELLGAKSFPDLNIRDQTIALVADKDLAEELENGCTLGQTVKHCGEVDGLPQKLDENALDTMINWPDLEIRKFSRWDNNSVYRQFFRFSYTVKVEVHETEFTLTMLSLPFTFNTGANQQLEHIGSRMWYCTNVDMYEGNFRCPDVLALDTVMTMLEKRVMCVTPAPRKLRDEDTAFLRSRLPVAKENAVSMQGFIKDKMQSPQDKKQEEQPAFYTWFHGVMNSFTCTLAKPWEKGIIYGFCYEGEARSKLMAPDVPEGTVLFRPSISKVENPSSKDANTMLVMEVKLRSSKGQSSEEYEIKSIPLYISFIKDNGLYRATRGIKRDSKSIANFLYGANGTNRKMVEVLMEYGKGERKPYIWDGYKVALQKMEYLNLDSSGSHVKEETSIKDGEPSKKQRKRRQDAVQISPTLPECSQTFTVSQEAGPVIVKQENPHGTEASSSQIHCQISELGQSHKFTELGGVAVDVSNLAHAFAPVAVMEVIVPGQTGNSPNSSSGFGSDANSPEVASNPNSPLDAFQQPTVFQSSADVFFSEAANLQSNFNMSSRASNSLSTSANQADTEMMVQHGHMSTRSTMGGFESTVIPHNTGNIPNVLHLATEPSKPRGYRSTCKPNPGKVSSEKFLSKKTSLGHPTAACTRFPSQSLRQLTPQTNIQIMGQQAINCPTTHVQHNGSTSRTNWQVDQDASGNNNCASRAEIFKEHQRSMVNDPEMLAQEFMELEGNQILELLLGSGDHQEIVPAPPSGGLGLFSGASLLNGDDLDEMAQDDFNDSQ